MVRWYIAASLFIAILTSSAIATADQQLLVPQGFTPDLAGWQRQGDAQFAQDLAQTYEGKPSARITIGPGTEPHYQQLRRDIAQDIQAGDELHATAWVRTQGTLVLPGGYLALEFVGAAGERVGIAHSRMGVAIGANQWEQLSATGTIPEGTKSIRLSLILHAHGTAWFAAPAIVRTGRQEPWPDMGNAQRQIKIDTNAVVLKRFGGVGFHAYHHEFPCSIDDMNNVIYKRWRELNPSFVRINHSYKWNKAKLDTVATHLLQMKHTGTEVYVTTWDPPVVKSDEERAAYAKRIVDDLEYLVRVKGCDNIHFYCMTNELSLTTWGSLYSDMPTFKAYHQALYTELKARKLAIGLLATDASPESWWNTVEWATKNMDDITAVYGGHHYINEFALSDERFYPWFAKRTTWAANLAHAKGKDFILGEFGSKQDGRTVDGIKLDVCVYFGTHEEPMVAIQMADAAIAAINSGVYAMGYWTFMDLPDNVYPGYANKWGLFKCSGDDRSTRTLYYGYGLMTRYLRGPATVYKVSCNDPRLRVAAMRNQATGAWSFAVLSRNKQQSPITLTLAGKPLSARLRKYVYDPKHVTLNPFGDLPGPQATVRMANGRLTDSVQAGTLTVYTTAFDDRAPAPVTGLTVKREESGVDRISWRPSTEKDLCYYRIYRSTTSNFKPSLAMQIGSTIDTSYRVSAVGGPWFYHIVAVDQSGNAGK